VKDFHVSVEDAGGLLTDFESEESPLSAVQAVDTSRDTEMGRSMVQKRTMCGVYDESGRTRLPHCRWDEQPRWSKSKQSR